MDRTKAKECLRVVRKQVTESYKTLHTMLNDNPESHQMVRELLFEDDVRIWGEVQQTMEDIRGVLEEIRVRSAKYGKLCRTDLLKREADLTTIIENNSGTGDISSVSREELLQWANSGLSGVRESLKDANQYLEWKEETRKKALGIRDKYISLMMEYKFNVQGITSSNRPMFDSQECVFDGKRIKFHDLLFEISVEENFFFRSTQAPVEQAPTPIQTPIQQAPVQQAPPPPPPPQQESKLIPASLMVVPTKKQKVTKDVIKDAKNELYS